MHIVLFPCEHDWSCQMSEFSHCIFSTVLAFCVFFGCFDWFLGHYTAHTLLTVVRLTLRPRGDWTRRQYAELPAIKSQAISSPQLPRILCQQFKFISRVAKIFAMGSPDIKSKSARVLGAKNTVVKEQCGMHAQPPIKCYSWFMESSEGRPSLNSRDSQDWTHFFFQSTWDLWDRH